MLASASSSSSTVASGPSVSQNVVRHEVLFVQERRGGDYFKECRVFLTEDRELIVEALGADQAQEFDRGLDLSLCSGVSVAEKTSRGDRLFVIKLLMKSGLPPVHLVTESSRSAKAWHRDLKQALRETDACTRVWEALRTHGVSEPLLDSLEMLSSPERAVVCQSPSNGTYLLHELCRLVASTTQLNNTASVNLESRSIADSHDAADSSEGVKADDQAKPNGDNEEQSYSLKEHFSKENTPESAGPNPSDGDRSTPSNSFHEDDDARSSATGSSMHDALREVLALVLENGPKIPQTRNARGMLPIHVLLSESGPEPSEATQETALRLLEANLDSVETSCDLGAAMGSAWMPIHLACASLAPSLVQIVIGMDTPRRRLDTFLGETPHLLQQTSLGETPLHIVSAALARSDLSPVALKRARHLCTLLTNLEPAALSVCDSRGETPLHNVAKAADLQVMRAMFESAQSYFLRAAPLRNVLDQTCLDVLLENQKIYARAGNADRLVPVERCMALLRLGRSATQLFAA